MSDYQRVPMKIGMIAGTIGILISLTTVKSYGYNGVAVGAGSSIIIHNCAMWLYCRKHLGITTHMRFDIIRSVHDFCTILKSVNNKKS